MQRWLSLALGTIIFGVIYVSAGEHVNAQGLVPECPVVGECEAAYDPQNYGTCELVALGSNVLRFVIGLVAVIGAIVMVYAGYLLVTSRGNVSAMERAKGMFTNILIGLVIALSAFLVVNTVMQMLVDRDGPLVTWDRVECSYANETGQATGVSVRLGQYTSNLTFDAVGNVVTIVGGGGGGGGTIAGPSVNELRAAAGACSPALITRIWGAALAGDAQCIIREESACGSLPISRTDRGADGNPFSFGAMQINTTVHPVRGCQHLGIPDLNCPSAWAGTDYAARVVNPALYQACRSALLNNECNMIVGTRVYRERRNSWAAWSTAGACGLR